MADYSAVSTTSSAITLVLTVTETSYSVANNTSAISWSLVLKKSSSTTASSSWKSTYSATIGGTSVLNVSTATTVAVSPGGSTTLGSGSLTVSHNSDGTKSFAVAAKIATSSSSGSYNCSISGTFTCTAIPRTSSITSAANVTMGSACAVTWTPASSSFTYSLKFTCGSGSYTASISPGTTSAYTYTGYTFPAATWAPYITSAASATVTATLTTLSGGSAIGTSSRTFTLYVPSSVVPTVSISVAPNTTYYSSYPYLTGVSQPVVTITKSGTYGSSISSVSTTFNGSTSSGASSVTFSAASSSGNYTITTTVKDSRGRSASASKTITYTAYTAPSITAASAIRASDSGGTEDEISGTYGYISFQCSYTSIASSASITIQYKQSAAGSYSTATNGSASSSAASGITTVTKTAYFSGAALDSAYTVLISLTDGIRTVTRSLTIPNAYALMYFGETGSSIMFGGISSSTASKRFEVASDWDTVIGGDLTVGGDLAVNGEYLLHNQYAFETSLNTITDSGIHSVNTGTGTPGGMSGWWNVVNLKFNNDPNYTLQFAFHISYPNRIYSRMVHASSGTQGAWYVLTGTAV